MPPDATLRVVEIRTTLPSLEAAERCGRDLVGRGLAACVQIDGPLTSIYRWQGAVETVTEFRCVCKTTVGRAEACVATITACHPYDIPEILSVTCVASAEYARWIDASVGGP
jgi:periplasmic divalent cation tolerance protein